MCEKEGVYVALLVSEDSTKKLHSFFDNIGLDISDSFNEYENRLHNTLIYSKNGFPNNITLNKIRLKVKPTGWAIFKSSMTGKDNLILKLEPKVLSLLHEELINTYNLSHAFDDYTPHISIHYDFKGEIPNDLPDFSIELETPYVKRLIYEKPLVRGRNSI